MDLTYFISPLANPIHSQFIMQKVHKMLSIIVTSNKKQGLAVEDFLLKKKKTNKKKNILGRLQVGRIAQSLELGRSDIWQTLFFAWGLGNSHALSTFHNFFLFLDFKQESLSLFNGGFNNPFILLINVNDSWNFYSFDTRLRPTRFDCFATPTPYTLLFRLSKFLIFGFGKIKNNKIIQVD
jgi:hypothetical protein